MITIGKALELSTQNMILARFWMRADSFFELKFDKVIMNSNTTKTLKQKKVGVSTLSLV